MVTRYVTNAWRYYACMIVSFKDGDTEKRPPLSGIILIAQGIAVTLASSVTRSRGTLGS